jgi:hypothetical protein
LSIDRVAGTVVMLVSVAVASLLAVSGAAAQTASDASQGSVKLEWLGHEFYRLTSPRGWWC